MKAWVPWMLSAALGACSSEAPAAPAPTPTAPCPAPAACPPGGGFDATAEHSPPVRLALDTLDDLLAGRYAEVATLFTPELELDLPTDKLDTIVRGLVAAHGPPASIADAWTSEIREKIKEQEIRSPAAQVLVRMQNGVRVNLLLVFDNARLAVMPKDRFEPKGIVKGLWLRPI